MNSREEEKIKGSAFTLASHDSINSPMQRTLGDVFNYVYANCKQIYIYVIQLLPQNKVTFQLFTEVEVASGGYLPSCEAPR